MKFAYAKQTAVKLAFHQMCVLIRNYNESDIGKANYETIFFFLSEYKRKLTE